MERFDNVVYHFALPHGMLSWQSIILTQNWKICAIPSFVVQACRNGLQHRNSDFKRLNLVTFSRVTLEFTMVKLKAFPAGYALVFATHF